MNVVPRIVDYYYTADGKCPYKEWFSALKVMTVRQSVDARLTRVRRGLFGDYRWVGQGVWEFRLDTGPGYRVYFAQPQHTLILLLGGGLKKTQSRDIRKAHDCWADYQRNPK